jgi:organic radical activating enzyme
MWGINMSKTARVLITSQCVRKCHYCCNKLPEVQETIKFTTMDQFIENAHKYDVINITGGEPQLESAKLINLLKALKGKTKASLYLYTTLPPTTSYYNFNSIDGINIGCHGNFNEASNAAYEWGVLVGKKVRLHMQQGLITDEQRDILKKDMVELKEWVMNECSNDNEERFII